VAEWARKAPASLREEFPNNALLAEELARLQQMARLWLGQLRFLLSVNSGIVERMVMMSPVRTSRLYSSGDVERINFASALDLAFDSDKFSFE